MQEIVDCVRQVTDIMGEINAASDEQTSGIEQINQAVIQMDNTTQQNAALVEEAAAAAQSMQDQAANLSQVVGAFKLNSHGGAVAVVSPRGVPKGALPGAGSVPRIGRGAIKNEELVH